MTMSQTTETEDLVRAGFEALRAGDRERARGLLMRAVRSDPRSEQAWLYLAGALTDPAQRRDCLERVLQLNPANAAARRGLEALGAALAAPARTPAPRPEPPLARPAPTPQPTTRLEPPVARPEPAPVPAPQPEPPVARPEPAPAPPTSLRALAEDPPAPTATPAPAVPLPAADPAAAMRSRGVFDAYLPPAASPAPVPSTPPATTAPTLIAPPAAPASEPGLAAIPAADAPARAEDRLVLWLAVALGALLMLVSAGYLLLLLR